MWELYEELGVPLKTSVASMKQLCVFPYKDDVCHVFGAVYTYVHQGEADAAATTSTAAATADAAPAGAAAAAAAATAASTGTVSPATATVTADATAAAAAAATSATVANGATTAGAATTEPVAETAAAAAATAAETAGAPSSSHTLPHGFTLQADEVEWVRWMPLDEVTQLMEKGTEPFTPVGKHVLKGRERDWLHVPVVLPKHPRGDAGLTLYNSYVSIIATFGTIGVLGLLTTIVGFSTGNTLFSMLGGAGVAAALAGTVFIGRILGVEVEQGKQQGKGKEEPGEQGTQQEGGQGQQAAPA
ncbi:hypothetical protein FOA52_004750 [Chlamydomonas sp. UWO 241]|nr:hypothetical protein FOA52_004750 [Chlamydomonas sp. UWO 241]